MKRSGDFTRGYFQAPSTELMVSRKMVTSSKYLTKAVNGLLPGIISNQASAYASSLLITNR